MVHSSLPSSSPSLPHFDSTLAKGNVGGGSAEDVSERKTRRSTDGEEEGSDGGSKREETAAAAGEADVDGQVVSLSIAASTPNTMAPLPLAHQGLTQVLSAVRMAPTVVTNVVRPIASTPISIASKPLEGAVTLSPQDKKATLLIGGGGSQQLPVTTGGGYSSSSSSPSPVSVSIVGGSGLVTSLVLGGSFPAAQPVQLLTPQSSQLPAPNPLPLLQPQLHPSAASASLTPPACPKPLTQVQYILPSESPSSPQLTHQQTSILSPPSALPINSSLANGVHSGAGIRFASVSHGTRGETVSKDRLTEKRNRLTDFTEPLKTEISFLISQLSFVLLFSNL